RRVKAPELLEGGEPAGLARHVAGQRREQRCGVGFVPAEQVHGAALPDQLCDVEQGAARGGGDRRRRGQPPQRGGDGVRDGRLGLVGQVDELVEVLQVRGGVGGQL